MMIIYSDIYVGDLNSYTVAGKRILLRRIGKVVQVESTVGWKLSPGTVRVQWIPKTKRGYPETYTHKVEELELIE